MKKKIFVRGPVLSQSGYGEQSRFALRALRSREDIFDIYVQPIPWGQTGWIWEDNEFRQWLDSRITQTQLLLQQQQLRPDVSLQITIPNEFQKICPENIGYTAGIETSKVSPQWLQKGNEEVDKILVVSEHAKTTYQNTTALAHDQTGKQVNYKLETPIEVVHECTPRVEAEDISELNLTTDFNFLLVSQMGPRKNYLQSIQGWVEEFHDQEVGLIVKTSIRNNSHVDSVETYRTLETILQNHKDRKCKVYMLHGDLTAGQMTGLYSNPKVKAMINIAHGEGFGLPLFEAAREGLPIVTIGWSGQQDFLTYDGKQYFQCVKHTLETVPREAVWDGVIVADSEWAAPTQGSYKMALRKIYKHWDDAKETATELQGLLEENFSEEKLYKGFCASIYNPSDEELEWMKELSEIEML